MPIRNPFAKRSEPVPDENARPSTVSGFEKTDVSGSRGSSTVSIIEPQEYKLSVVNDSGVYLPPSPPEKKSFFSRRSAPSTRRQPSTNPILDPIEPFSISRASFDSYRRSFDISARTPLPQTSNNSPASTPNTPFGRQSLDARLPYMPRSSIADMRRPFDQETPREEKEEFEDVVLGGSGRTPGTNVNVKQEKKGFFARFGERSSDGAEPNAKPEEKNGGFHLFGGGRKRGHSGGQELGTFPVDKPVERPDTPIRDGREVEPSR